MNELVFPVPRPLNEADRLEALRSYRIMDSGRERAYEDIVRLASHICGTPMAAVTLLDEERQWFKARVGLDAEGTTRDEAFCSYTILGSQVMVVRDATLDGRFRENPLVTGELGIRFYAGAPLVTPGGFALGALCVMDREPRAPSDSQLEALESLAHLVADQFEQRKATATLAEALERVRTLAGLIPICSYCRRIRDDGDYWTSLEEYLKDRADADVSHGICPTCAEEHFSEEILGRILP